MEVEDISEDILGKKISFVYTINNGRPLNVVSREVTDYLEGDYEGGKGLIRLDDGGIFFSAYMSDIKLGAAAGGGKRKSRRNRKSKKTKKSNKTKKTKKSKKSTRRKR